MPADHGTPNTGDERDHEAADRYDALAAKEADRLRAGIRGSVLMEALVDAETELAQLKAAPSPARDGTVAVEDVAHVARELRGLWLKGAGPETCAQLADRLDAALAEFGVSERTERIHDQATKENQ